MSKIDIGTVIDLDDLIESRMLIQANSGGGKSGIARVIMEESVGKIPFIVLDKKGEYYTLKEKFPDILIIGGRSGDVPISLQAASKLAKLIISHKLTVVIDMAGMDSDDQRAVFIKDFLKGMMNLTEDYWCQYLIFLEEAHVFCGQQETMPSARYVKSLMSEGRKMGFCGILLTQRISKLHKDAAAECNNKFIGRTFLDLDINRSASEMGLVGQDKYKLRELKPQHFWAFGTSIQPHHVHEVVIKDAKTKFPKAGVKINLANIKPTDKVKKALVKLNELPQEAAKELLTIKELQAEVKRLNAELKKKPVASAPQDGKLKEQVTLLEAQLKEQKSASSHWMKHALHRDGIIQKALKQLSDLPSMDISPATKGVPLPKDFMAVKSISTNDGRLIVPHGSKEHVFLSRHPQHKDYDGKPLPPGERAVLTACAQFGHALGREQLTVLTGYKRSSRDAYIARLKEKGMVEQSGDGIQATLGGLTFLGKDFEPLPTGEELQQYWLNKLPLGEKAILERLISCYPDAATRDDLSSATGYQRSSRDAYISRMAAKELVVAVGRGEVKASDNLFD